MCKKKAASLALAILIVVTSTLDVEGEEYRKEETVSGEEKVADEDTGISGAKGKMEGDAVVEQQADEDAGEIPSVEDANKALSAYEEETAQWEEIYIDSVEDMKEFSRNCWLDTWSADKKVYDKRYQSVWKRFCCHSYIWRLF